MRVSAVIHGVLELNRGVRCWQACGSTEEEGNYGWDGVDIFFTFAHMAVGCGLPPGTLQLTPPALTTCDGAKWKDFMISRCGGLVGLDACAGV